MSGLRYEQIRKMFSSALLLSGKCGIIASASDDASSETNGQTCKSSQESSVLSGRVNDAIIFAVFDSSNFAIAESSAAHSDELLTSVAEVKGYFPERPRRKHVCSC